MRGDTPRLYVKNTGNHVAKWGGREWSFGVDAQKASAAFLDPAGRHDGALVHWISWREATEEDRKRKREHRGGPTIATLAKEFLADYYDNGRKETEAYYRAALRRFVNTFGAIRTSDFSVQAFDAFRKSLLRLDLAPRTMVHDLKAVKTMWLWGHPRNLCPPIDFRGVKLPRLPRSVPEPLPGSRIAQIVQGLEAKNRTLAAWVAFNYLTGCRPSEVVRVSQGEGQLITLPPEPRKKAIPDAAIELREHKISRKTDASRFIVISPEALLWLPHVKPLHSPQKSETARQNLLNAYGRSLRLAGWPGLAHKLRDSAATHLLAAGVDQGSVDLVLGHVPTGELGSYGRPSLRVLREIAARLTLKSGPRSI